MQRLVHIDLEQYEKAIEGFTQALWCLEAAVFAGVCD